MNHISSTPFGSRPVTAGLIQAVQMAESKAALPHVDKWEVFRQLCAARQAFGITDRDLTVLNALLSFHIGKSLGDNASLVVFPSNRALSSRAHGMPESTLRRHLAALVTSGIVVRRDSPNGKRYAHKDRQGDIVRAFGFDLRPLLTRAEEISRAAQEIEARAERLRGLRTDVSILKRDTLKLALYGQEEGLAGDWSGLLADLMQVHRAMRRKLDENELAEIAVETGKLLTRVQGWLSINTDKMSGSDDENERPFQNSNKDLTDFEPCLEKQKAQGEAERESDPVTSKRDVPVPLVLIVKACPDLAPYAEGAMRNWAEFVRAAEVVRGMMGISPSGYQEACETMGREAAAVVVACMLQRIDQIKSPGGYLRCLSRKAELDAFSVGPMVMALLNGSSS